MEFCPKCGSILEVKGDKGVCPKCGYKLKKKPKVESSEKIIQKESVPVISESSQDSTYPVVEMKCPQCKNTKAYFWTMQTRAADESETKFYKCTKCKHTWRVYR